ncbi:transposase [Burkholderia lata]|uniref:transposase n=1 Tax=Burkholderia lata (strain ATCC 17760 / DSM 23089 / LMG 22485 / NCIMB 9086 / R18194 / 383) TaxID=482957 RepID=UPI0039995A40
MGFRLMKPTAHRRQLGSKNYMKEFREAVVAEASGPNRSIAEVARRHGLNANIVAQCRRKSLRHDRPRRHLA